MIKYRRLKLAITDDCSLNCTHCYLGGKTARHADVNRITARITEARSLGVQILDLTGGEPTMHPDFDSILTAAGNAGFDQLNLSTNGLHLLREPILSGLATFKVRCFISLDGATEDTMSRIRGANVLSSLHRAFRILSAARIIFSLRMSVNRLNMIEIEKVWEIAERWGADLVLEPTQLSGNASEDLLLDEEQMLRVRSVIAALKPKANVCLEESFCQPCVCDGSISSLLSLNVTGMGVGCLMMESRRHVHDSTESQSLDQLWDQAEEAKRKLREFRPNFGRCSSCRYRGLCLSGCWVTASSCGCLVTS